MSLVPSKSHSFHSRRLPEEQPERSSSAGRSSSSGRRRLKSDRPQSRSKSKERKGLESSVTDHFLESEEGGRILRTTQKKSSNKAVPTSPKHERDLDGGELDTTAWTLSLVPSKSRSIHRRHPPEQRQERSS